LAGRRTTSRFCGSAARVEQSGLRHAAQPERCDHSGQSLNPVHKAASPSLGTLSVTDRRWSREGRTGGVQTPRKNRNRPRRASRCSQRIRVPSGRAVVTKFQNAPRLVVLAISAGTIQHEVLAGRHLTIGDSRSSSLDRQPQNVPLNFSSPQTANELRRFSIGSQRP
jgi:ribosomal protein L34E